MYWQCAAFNELSLVELYKMLALRSAVFVVEQDCAYQDLDGVDCDPRVFHLNLWRGQQLIATARLIGPGVQAPDQVWIGRVAVLYEARGQGLSRQLLQQALDKIHHHWPRCAVRLNAQQYVAALYESMGFEVVGETYIEDGIPHQMMELSCKD